MVQEIENINAYEASKRINDILNLGIDFGRKAYKSDILKTKTQISIEEKFRKWEKDTFQILCDYLHLLWKWEKIEDFDNELFVESLQNKDYIEYLIDEIFINGTDKEKIWFWKHKNNLILELIEKMKEVKNECGFN